MSSELREADKIGYLSLGKLSPWHSGSSGTPHNSVPYSAGSHRTLKEPVWIGEISREEFEPVVRFPDSGLARAVERPLGRVGRA